MADGTGKAAARKTTGDGDGPKVYICQLCSWAYDEAAAGVKFADLPEDFMCAICGAGKDAFGPA